MNMKTFLNAFIADETGASAAEYALILAIVGVAIGAAALSLGANVRTAIADASNDVYSCSVEDTSTVAATATALTSC